MASVPLSSEMLRNRASQCRHLASGIRDDQIKDRLLRLATEYDQMARREVLPQQPRKAPIDLAVRLARKSKFI